MRVLTYLSHRPQLTSTAPADPTPLASVLAETWPLSAHLQNFRTSRDPEGSLFALLTLHHRPLAAGASEQGQHDALDIDLGALALAARANTMEVSRCHKCASRCGEQPLVVRRFVFVARA